MTKMKINTKWIPWNQRNNISKNDQPAIYYIAYSELNIEGNDFSYIEEIVYNRNDYFK